MNRELNFEGPRGSIRNGLRRRGRYKKFWQAIILFSDIKTIHQLSRT